ncbi:Pentatricopeptide repeat-containing protein [Hordeum vulgare]|nr:Pentatricopeptide repeat-containing protein [Hordeum vulgare]
MAACLLVCVVPDLLVDADKEANEKALAVLNSLPCGIVDQSHYILCLLESESPEDHQIAVEMISGDERFHIATLPTSDQAKKFVDQFILLHLDLLIYDLQEGVKEQLLSRRSDRLVIAFGLLNTSPATRLVVIKNLRACGDWSELRKTSTLKCDSAEKNLLRNLCR